MLIGQASINFSANILSAVLGLLSVFVFTRLFSPHDYGVYLLGVGFASVISVFLVGWFRNLILSGHAKDDGTDTGVMPRKLGHVAFHTPDVAGTVKFYCDVLGFKVSDWRSDFFAFLRCSRDHHTINLLQADNANIHHLAFELRDEAEINRACDLLARKDIKLFWGPIRHLIGHNIAIYHKNPDGITVEFFTDLDQMHDEELGYFEPRPWHQDRPQRPKVWGDDTPTNYWGPGHPHDMPGPKK